MYVNVYLSIYTYIYIVVSPGWFQLQLGRLGFCFVLFLVFFCFPSWLLKCCNLQHFLAKCTYFTRPSTSSASFSTSPACPANIASITSKLASRMRIQSKAQRGLGGGGSPPLKGGGSPPMMIEKLGAKNLRSNGRMMIEKVMIQLGAKSPK